MFRLALALVPFTFSSAQLIPVGSPLLSDDFTQDPALRDPLWHINTPLVRGMVQREFPENTPALVAPRLSFSSQGMSVTGVAGPKQFAGIKSKQSFVPPFTVEASVMSLASHRNAFALYQTNGDPRSSPGSEPLVLNPYLRRQRRLGSRHSQGRSG